MPVNGFSFLSEKFFNVSSLIESLGRVCMLGSAQKNAGTAVPDRVFDLKPDRAIHQEPARSKYSRNFVRRARNRKRKPTRRDLFPGFRAPFPNPGREKVARCPQSRRDFHVNFPRLPVARTNRQSTAITTTAQ